MALRKIIESQRFLKIWKRKACFSCLTRITVVVPAKYRYLCTLSFDGYRTAVLTLDCIRLIRQTWVTEISQWFPQLCASRHPCSTLGYKDPALPRELCRWSQGHWTSSRTQEHDKEKGMLACQEYHNTPQFLVA